MKTAAFTLSALAAVVAAQDFSNLGSCAAQCGSNMLGSDKARELGCDNGDLQCLCQNPDFTYGLRDCTREACAGDDEEALVSAGLEFCSGVGVEITTGSDGSPTVTATSGGAMVTTISSDGSAITTSTMEASDIRNSATSALGSITSSTGDKVSSASSAVTSALGSASDAVTSALGSASSAVTSALGSASDALSSARESASDALSSARESATSTSDGDNAENTSASDDAAMPMRTAAPAGILAAAGLAVLML